MEQAARANDDCVDKDGSDKESRRDDKDNRGNKEENRSDKSKDEGNGREKKEKRDTSDKKMTKLNDDAIVFLRKRSAADAARYAGSLRSIMDLQRKRQRADEARQAANRVRGLYVTCRKCAQRKESGHREDDAAPAPGARPASGESESDDQTEGRPASRCASRPDARGVGLVTCMASVNRSDSLEPADACRRKKKKKKKKRCPRKRKPVHPQENANSDIHLGLRSVKQNRQMRTQPAHVKCHAIHERVTKASLPAGTDHHQYTNLSIVTIGLVCTAPTRQTKQMSNPVAARRPQCLAAAELIPRDTRGNRGGPGCYVIVYLEMT
ncbi:hypothetical protein EVAR_96218_1 [Eumeta japonica]|uniref:Uncharacterized protein n=1 Tax=Eumeta variegata TaxID=151549 RepID=A0A4C1WMA7_EUMVA|nr:hypothetical protein EVAR_96218_1 [Eumeta japonica]